MRSPAASALLGATFLMATSAIGPGFLTQTAVYTSQLLGSFGFVILVSVLLDIGAQWNIWRILTVSELRAPELADRVLPGLGYLLGALVAFGGLAFNIGNIGGCGLGLQILTGLDIRLAATFSAGLAVLLFWAKDAGRIMDLIVRALGLLLLALTLYVAVAARPPLAQALWQTVWPERIDALAIVTLVGGTVGGYISFAGAHRLLDAGIKGREALPQVDRSAVQGILVTALMRYVLFLAAFGVLAAGHALDPANPPASVFQLAAGAVGYRLFGLVMWCAAITSVIGSAYTSISFLDSWHPGIRRNKRLAVTVFIAVSTVVFLWLGKPVQLLVLAGTVNGFILPVALAVVLLALQRSGLLPGYRHPRWLSAAGWLVVVAMGWMAVQGLFS